MRVSGSTSISAPKPHSSAPGGPWCRARLISASSAVWQRPLTPPASTASTTVRGDWRSRKANRFIGSEGRAWGPAAGTPAPRRGRSVEEPRAGRLARVAGLTQVAGDVHALQPAVGAVEAGMERLAPVHALVVVDEAD